MADDLSSQLEDWFKQVKKLAPDRSTKAKMTLAGGEVLREAIAAKARAKHYSNKKDPVYGHMADAVKVVNTNADGVKTGVSVVGWENATQAMNAVYTNDGTTRFKGDFWYDQTVEECKEAVFEAEKAVYEESLK